MPKLGIIFVIWYAKNYDIFLQYFSILYEIVVIFFNQNEGLMHFKSIVCVRFYTN